MLCVLLIWIVLEASPLTAGADFQCGRSVGYNVPHTPLCLHHNVTISTPVRAVLGKVSSRLVLVPGQPVELHPLRNSYLTLKSSRTLCYFLSKQRCQVRERVVKKRGRDIRSAYTVDEGEAMQIHAPSSHELLLMHVALSALALLVLSPLAMAAFLCCPAGGNTKQTFSRTFSRRGKGKDLNTSNEISINITDSDHPLGSDHFTTFHKDKGQHVPSPVALGKAQSEPTLLEQQSPQGMLGSTPQLLESSLDIGTRPESYQEGQHLGASVSSLHSLGPRVPPEGSSLGNLSSIEKQPHRLTRTPSPHHPLDMPPPPRVPPPPSNAHIRQNSTPISLPPSLLPTSPLQKPRPLTVIGKPSDQHSITGMRYPVPALPPKPRHSPPLSPVSLTESEALGPVRPGRVNPYRVVHQPSPSLTSLSHLPHTSDGSQCIQCGARLSGSAVLEPVSEVPGESNEEESNSAAASDDLCQQCQVSGPHYQELNSPSDEDERSPSPPNNGTTTFLPDPVYERIGSIRGHHVAKPTSRASSDDRSPPTSRPPAPSPPAPVHLESSLQTSISSSLSSSHFPKCPLPSEGAPLPPRPPMLKLLRGDSSDSNHDYESLPSTFDQNSDTVYARITSPEEEEASTPPFVPENSQRAQMLKIDSQGYAEVVSNEGDEPRTPDPDPGYSPCLPLSPSNTQLAASDYEVPVRIASFPGSSPIHLQPATSQLSPSLLSSPTHSNTSNPIPVPSPVSPSSHPAPPTLPLPFEQPSTSPSIPAPLRRQGAVTDNTGSVPSRSMQVVPRKDRESLEDRRDSTHSAASYHLSFRFSTVSSTLGESMSDSLLAIAEEDVEHTDQTNKRETVREVGAVKYDDQRNADKIGEKDKIYEVENRSRTNSYPVLAANQGQPGADVASHKYRAQTMRMLISFNKDSQAV